MAVRIHYRGYFWSGSSHTEGNALQVPDDFYSLGANTRCAYVHFLCALWGSVYFCVNWGILASFDYASIVCVAAYLLTLAEFDAMR